MSLARDVEAVERAVWAEMYAAPPQSFRDAVGLTHRRFDGALALIAARIPDTQFNRVIGFGVDSPASEAELDLAIEAMRASGAPRWWLQPPPDEHELIAAIEARGFVRTPRPWAKMARPATPAIMVETELRVEQIGPAGIGAYSEIVCAAFGAPPLLGQWFAALAAQPNWRFYLAYDGDKAVAGAALWCDGATAWLGIAATAPQARRRGGQGALMARRIEDARRVGAKLIVTETGEKQPGVVSTSYDNMIRHGFEVVHARPNFERVSSQ